MDKCTIVSPQKKTEKQLLRIEKALKASAVSRIRVRSRRVCYDPKTGHGAALTRFAYTIEATLCPCGGRLDKKTLRSRRIRWLFAELIRISIRTWTEKAASDRSRLSLQPAPIRSDVRKTEPRHRGSAKLSHFCFSCCFSVTERHPRRFRIRKRGSFYRACGITRPSGFSDLTGGDFPVFFQLCKLSRSREGSGIKCLVLLPSPCSLF